MKKLVLLLIIYFPSICHAQHNLDIKNNAPPYFYITPEMQKAQVDSVIDIIKGTGMTVKFEILEWDQDKKIRKAKGTFTGGFGMKDSGSFETDDFKGLTFHNSKEHGSGVFLGIIVRKALRNY
jgi:hypothetical protein